MKCARCGCKLDDLIATTYFGCTGTYHYCLPCSEEVENPEDPREEEEEEENDGKEKDPKA
jgi:hypothetical protein